MSILYIYVSYSPTGTGGTHVTSIKSAGNAPHQTDPPSEYKLVDKTKKKAIASHKVCYLIIM